MRKIFLSVCLLALAAQIVMSKNAVQINYACLNAIDNGVKIVEKFIKDYNNEENGDAVLNDYEAFYLNKDNIIENCPKDIGLVNYDGYAADANCRRLLNKLAAVLKENSQNKDRFKEHLAIINASFDLMPGLMINCVPR